jgi:hypothetical protein
MKTKLTLKLDQSVIDSVKEYAETNNRSLSKLVEDYFRNLVSETAPRQNDYPSLIKKLTGVISERDLEKLSREMTG